MLLTGAPLTSAKAERAGFAETCCDATDLEERTAQIVAGFCAAPDRARAIKDRFAANHGPHRRRPSAASAAARHCPR
jgi:enoyl-CoA hydratase/carnithine racemase